MLSMLLDPAIWPVCGDEFGLLLPDCNSDSAFYRDAGLSTPLMNITFMWEGRSDGRRQRRDYSMINEHNCQLTEVVRLRPILPATPRKNSGRGRLTVYEPQHALTLLKGNDAAGTGI